MTRQLRRQWLLRGTVAAGAFVAAFATIDIVDRLLDDGESGGNAVALEACERFATQCADALNAVRESGGDRPVSVNAIRWEGGEFGFRAANRRASRVGAALYMVHPDQVVRSDRPTVVVVSPTTFEDLPRPSVWRLYQSGVAHAVGYSDGTVALLSPKEFATLDLEDFVPLDDWLLPAEAPDLVRLALSR